MQAINPQIVMNILGTTFLDALGLNHGKTGLNQLTRPAIAADPTVSPRIR